MKAQITVDMDNATFTDQTGIELARILKGIACDIEESNLLPGVSCTLRDYNGNKVGRFEITD